MNYYGTKHIKVIKINDVYQNILIEKSVNYSEILMKYFSKFYANTMKVIYLWYKNESLNVLLRANLENSWIDLANTFFVGFVNFKRFLCKKK